MAANNIKVKTDKALTKSMVEKLMKFLNIKAPILILKIIIYSTKWDSVLTKNLFLWTIIFYLFINKKLYFIQLVYLIKPETSKTNIF